MHNTTDKESSKNQFYRICALCCTEHKFDMLPFHKRMCSKKKGFLVCFLLFYDFIAVFCWKCCPVVVCITKRNMPTQTHTSTHRTHKQPAINKRKSKYFFLLLTNMVYLKAYLDSFFCYVGTVSVFNRCFLSLQPNKGCNSEWLVRFVLLLLLGMNMTNNTHKNLL